MNVETIMAALWKHWRLLVGCSLVFGLAALGSTFLVTPTYEAEADVALVKNVIDVNFDPRFRTISENSITQDLIDQAARRKSLATIAGSPDVAGSVAARLSAQWSDAERAPLQLVRAINARSDGDLIRISAKSNTPDKAMALANTWAQVYTDRANEIYGSSPLSSSDIQAKTETAKREYLDAEAAYVRYLADYPSRPLARLLQEDQQMLDDSLAVGNRLDRLLADAHSLRDRLGSASGDSSLGNELARLLLETASFSTSSTLPATAPAGSTSASTPLSFQFQVDPLKLGATPAQQRSDVDALIATLTLRRSQIQSTDVAQLQQKVNELQSQLEQEDSTRRELVRVRDLAWTTYSTLSNKAAEVAVSEQVQGSVARLAVAAVLPQDPVEPQKRLYVALGGAAGLALGLVLAVLLEFTPLGTAMRAARGSSSKSSHAPANTAGE